MPRYKIVIAKRYKTLDALCDELIARKRTLRIDEIVDMVKDFSKQNEGIFDDIIISDDRNHSNKTFFDSRFPSYPHNKEFSGINYHSAANPRGVFPASLNQLCKFLRMAYTLRVGSQVLEEMKETTAAPKWRIVEAKLDKEADLREWFKKEKWVDLRRPKKDGGYEPCGRGDTSKGKKPVCTPANKAKNINKKERTQRLKEKAKKEKEPNPDKKPNVTKYSPGAGGKSKASESHNIRFVGSMIPLSDLRPKQPKFIKIALFGEEDEFPSTDVSGVFSEQDDKISSMAEQIQKEAFTKLAEILSHQMGLSGPDAPSINFIKQYENPVQEEMTEQEYIRFIRHKNAVIRSMYKQASEGSDSKLYETLYKMILKGVNPFNYSDTVEVVREVLEK
jgi:hypothetical protein